jgi:predicted small lipoprotein YifL
MVAMVDRILGMNKRLSVASRAMLLMAIGGWAAGLAACGQKGPLTLPADKSDKQAKAAAPTSAHAASAPTPAASAASAP